MSIEKPSEETRHGRIPDEQVIVRIVWRQNSFSRLRKSVSHFARFLQGISGTVFDGLAPWKDAK
jgi:hypothetical protein